MKKSINTREMKSQLEGSVFFQKNSREEPTALPDRAQPPEEQEDHLQSSQQPSTIDAATDVNSDVTASVNQDINFRKWRDVIENTETHNSALRITTQEKEAIEDVISELKRKYGVKTSMNEIARLGLLYIIHDFKKNKKKALLHSVKKS